MSLILIRHAATDAHDDFYSGQVDIPLNAAGRQQAEALAGRLGDYPLDAILSSPLQRTRDTAAPLATARGLSIERHAALQEISYGQFEGKAKAAHDLQLRKRHICTPVAGGESLWQLWQRLEPLAVALRRRDAQGQRLALVGHYWSNRLLLGLLLEMPFELALRNRDYKPGNASALLLSLGHDAAKAPSCHWIEALGAPTPLRLQTRY